MEVRPGTTIISLVPKLAKNIFAGPAKAGAVRQQHNHRSNSPSHAQHGESGAAAIGGAWRRRLREIDRETWFTPVAAHPQAAALRLWRAG